MAKGGENFAGGNGEARGRGDEKGCSLFLFSQERKKKVLIIIRTAQEAQPSPVQPNMLLGWGTGVLRVVGEVSPTGDRPRKLICPWRRGFSI